MLSNKFRAFWKYHGNLFLGVLIYLSTQTSLEKNPAILWLCWLSYLIFGALMWAWCRYQANWCYRVILIIVMPLVWAQTNCACLRTSSYPPPGSYRVKFAVSDLDRSQRGWRMTGRLTIKSPTVNSATIPTTQLRVIINAPSQLKVQPGKWEIDGHLHQLPFSRIWIFQSPSHRNWIAQPTPWSRLSALWSLMRYGAKAQLEKMISSSLPPTRARAFIIGLCTGKLVDQRLNYTLSKVGLSHLLAVSGFHFACVTGMAEWVISGLFKRRNLPLGLLPIAIYFAYMGPSASVFRAAIMSGGRCLVRWKRVPYQPLDLLGLSLGLWCLLWPDRTREIGFALSYVCTAALLLLSGPIDSLAQKLWPSSDQPLMNKLHKRSLTILSTNLSAHLITAFPLLYLWHVLSISSLWYNIAIPPIVASVMQVLLLALCGSIVPPVGRRLLVLSHWCLSHTLNTLDVTKPWECQVWGECSLALTVWITASLLFIGLWHYAQKRRVSPIERWIV